MKRITAIIAAIALAFAIALGDQVISLSMSGNPLGIKSLQKLFASESDRNVELDGSKPKLPTITETPPTEPDLSYDERIEKGNYYFDRGFLNFAANEYAKAANQQPSRAEPFMKLATTNFELGEYSKAQKNAEQVLELSPNDFDAQHLLAEILIKLNDFEGAQAKVGELLAAGFTDPELFYYQALLNIVFNEHEVAKDTLQQMLVLGTELDSELTDNIDKILAAYNEFQFAQSAEELYLGELLARAFNQAGEYEFAVYKLKDILQQRADLRDGWILLGFAYLNLEKPLFALTSFERAYNLDSQWPATQYFLGLTYNELGQHEDSIVFLNYALQNGFEPGVVVQQKLADLYIEVERYEDAATAYEQVLAVNKQSAESFVRPIWLYLEFLDQPGEAFRLGQEAVLLFPESAMSYNLLGWSQAGTGNNVEAEKNLKKALSIDPTLAAAQYNLGKLYEDMERYEEALTAYEQAYEIDLNGSIGNLAAQRYNQLLAETQ